MFSVVEVEDLRRRYDSRHARKYPPAATLLFVPSGPPGGWWWGESRPCNHSFLVDRTPDQC